VQIQLLSNFYVDDGLNSYKNDEEAIKLVQDARSLCLRRDLRLHKFMSNIRKVMQSIPDSKHGKEMNTLDKNFDVLPIERVLGIEWCVESDQFQFHLTLHEHPITLRGILSSAASVYDSLVGTLDLKIPRSFILHDVGSITHRERHHLLDTSSSGYRQCSYLRLVNEDHNVHCTLVMGKPIVALLKLTTIPRRELTAALTSVKISNIISAELTYKNL